MKWLAGIGSSVQVIGLEVVSRLVRMSRELNSDCDRVQLVRVTESNTGTVFHDRSALKMIRTSDKLLLFYCRGIYIIIYRSNSVSFHCPVIPQCVNPFLCCNGAFVKRFDDY